MMIIHLDLLKDDGEPSSNALVPSKARTNYHTLHTGQPHLVFGYLVFGTECYISPGPTSTLCTRASHSHEVIEGMTWHDDASEYDEDCPEQPQSLPSHILGRGQDEPPGQWTFTITCFRHQLWSRTKVKEGNISDVPAQSFLDKPVHCNTMAFYSFLQHAQRRSFHWALSANMTFCLFQLYCILSFSRQSFQ